MATYGTPILAIIFAWWFSTGAILYLDGLPRRTYRWSFGVASLLSLGALWAVVATADETSVYSAYVAVLGALALWGWNEMAFLFGYITGSRREPCPVGASGMARFGHATRAILHHEVALLASLALIGVLTWGQPNQFGLATFATLFAMRLSTKLNIFLGVPNTTVEFLPDHLSYLTSYFRHKPMNALFPLSVTLATLATAWLTFQAAASDPFLATGFALLATLAALGLIEHWFLVVPLPVAGLWAWGMRSHDDAALGAARPNTAASPRAGSETATPRAISPPSLVA